MPDPADVLYMSDADLQRQIDALYLTRMREEGPLNPGQWAATQHGQRLQVLSQEQERRRAERKEAVKQEDLAAATLSELGLSGFTGPGAVGPGYDEGHEFGYTPTHTDVRTDLSEEEAAAAATLKALGVSDLVGSGYEQGHDFGYSKRIASLPLTPRLVLFGGVGIFAILLLGLAYVALGRGITPDLNVLRASSNATANSSPATSQGVSTAGSSAPLSATSVPAAAPPASPVVGAQVVGIGRSGRVIDNKVSELVTCEIRAWPGATIHGTFSGPWGPQLPSPVTFDVLAGSVFVVNFSGPPYTTKGTPLPAPSLSPNASTAVVQLVLPADVQPRGPATCTITSVTGVPSGSTLSPGRSSWTLTAPI